MTGETRGAPGESTRQARALPPALIALGGALVAGLCLLLLLGPFYQQYAGPADHMQHWLMMMLDGRGPFALERLLRFRFPLLLVLLFGAVLVLVPWRRAVHLQRGRRGADQASPGQAAREQRAMSRGTVRAAPAAAVPRDETAEQRSVAELGEMARTAGIRWRPEYATEGGARALLEILRALEDGSASAEIAEPEPDLAPEPDLSPGPDLAPASAAGADAPPVPAPTATGEGADPDPEEPAAPAWSPSYSSSVYTPTVLYGTEREEAAPADPEGSDVYETPEDGRAQR